MKTITSQFIKRLLLPLLPLLFYACTADITEETIVEESGTGLSICAMKGAFANSEAPQTRLSTPDYLSTFTDGDQIGITIIEGGGAVFRKYNNICYTYQGETGKWVTKSSNPPIYENSSATYIAYYPYNENMNNKMTIDDIINNFTPQTDQSTPERYNLSDLMTATGLLNETAHTLTFDFTHQMSLYEFHLTGKTYQTETNNYIYSQPLESGQGTISATVDGTETPLYYHLKNDTYRLLAKPGASVSYTVSITSGGVTYNAANQSLASLSTPGTYKRYKLRCGTPETRNFQQGDYYYSDGTILPKENTLSIPDSNPRLGIIFQVGAGWGETVSDYDGKLANDFINGYVACPSSGDGGNYGYGSSNQNKGYYNTTTIYKAIQEGKGTNAMIMTAYNYEKKHPTPKGTSGWYIPASNQLSTMYGRKGSLGISFSMWVGSSTSGGKGWYVTENNYGLYTTSTSNGAAGHPIFTF